MDKTENMKQDLEFLKKLQALLRKGTKEGQSKPRYWAIMDYRSVLSDRDCEESVLDWIKVNEDSESRLAYVRKEGYIVQDSLFLTKKDAEEYLSTCGDKHSSDAHPYVMSVMRTPNVEELFALLERFDWDSVEIKE